MTANKNGIFDMPDKEYFATDGLSNSYLWRLISHTPAHAQIGMTPTDAMDLGSAVHLAVLQPDLVEKQLIQGPKDWRGKKWTEAHDAAPDGAIVLVEKEYAQVMTMRDKVWSNSTIASILSGKDAQYEKAAFFEHRGQQCKLKLDACVDDVLIDLKTSIDASPRGFAQSVAKYGYHQQAASYRYGWTKATVGFQKPFIFIVIEKTPPFAAAIYELDAPTLAEGWASWNAAIDQHLECVNNQHFPGYADEKVLLQIPGYAFRHTNPRGIDLTGAA
tara:strand:+ start:322 stop:1143 length:822 start_codon:yes stop_codon:yes gene_type:complete